MTIKTDIVIVGAGIAGLWAFNRLKRMGYDVLLLENTGIGGGQSIASQGIIHSGLKYAFAGQINDLAKSISAMPDLWREALNGNGPVDLSAAKINANSQYLLIPKGFMGGLVKLVTKKALGGNVHEVAKNEWPDEVKQSGFKGYVVYMDEPVLDIPSVIRALAEPYKDCIRNASLDQIDAKKIIYTSAANNLGFAKANNHEKGLKAQARPLVQGFMKPAPFEFYAHLVGQSDKPVATITTHKDKDGTLVWYMGGGVAERAIDANPQDAVDFAKKGFAKYLPNVDLRDVQWSTLPINRIEGKSDTHGWLPDTPTIHKARDHLYCWPTKLTFAPMLSDMIVEWLDIEPSNKQSDFSALPEIDYSRAPWDEVEWLLVDGRR